MASHSTAKPFGVLGRLFNSLPFLRGYSVQSGGSMGGLGSVLYRAVANDKLRRPYREVPIVYACVTRIVNEGLAQVPLILMRDEQDRSGKRMLRWLRGAPEFAPRHVAPGLSVYSAMRARRQKGMVVDESHEFNTLLQRPNATQSMSAFITAIGTYLMTSGNRYGGEVFVVPEDARGGPVLPGQMPAALYPHRGDCFEALASTDWRLSGWEFTDPVMSRRQVYLPSQVVQIKRFDPDNPLRGLSPLEAAVRSARTIFNTLAYNEALQQNGMDPGGLIMPAQGSEALGDREFSRFRKMFRGLHEGSKNAGKWLFLQQPGMSVDRWQVSFRDMQYEQLLKMAGVDIRRVYDVPESILDSNSANMATAHVEKRSFWTSTIMSLGKLIEDEMNYRFAPILDGAVIAFDYTTVDALMEDATVQLDRAKKLFDLGVPLDDVNQYLGLELPNFPWGRTGFLSASLVRAEDAANPPEPVEPEPAVKPNAADAKGAGADPTAKGVGFLTKRDDARRRKIANTYERDVLEPQERSARGKISKYLFNLGAAQLKLVGGDEGKGLLAGSAKVLTARTREIIHELAPRVIECECTPALSALLREVSPASVEKLLFDLDTWNSTLKATAAPIHAQSLLASTAALESELGGLNVFEVDGPEASAFLRSKLIRVTQINTNVRERLRATLLDAMASGESQDAIRERVRQVMNTTSARANAIARTEVGQTASGGRFMAMRAEGIEKSDWIAGRDAATRKTHRHLDGLAPMVIGHNYLEDLGKTGKGVLEYPSDIRCTDPSEIVNCRCVAAAVE